MISEEQARARADSWINAGVPPERRREVGIYAFDGGWVVWGKEAPPADRERRPSTVGSGRGVIDAESGELTFWPSLPAPVIAERYRRLRGKQVAGDGGGTPATSRPPRRGRFAMVGGVTYEANIDMENKQVRLISADSASIAQGFTAVGPNRYSLRVPAHTVDAFYDISTVCRWRGEPFQALFEKDGRWMLWFLGRDSRVARDLGLTEYDRGVWNILVDPSEVTDVVEERQDLPLPGK